MTDWAQVRAHLRTNRYDLAVQAADEFPTVPKLAGTPLLTDPSWVPNSPIPLADLTITMASTPQVHLPQASGHPDFPSYSAAMATLDRPTVFENRPTWRLLEANLTTRKLTFGNGTYFDSIDTGEAAAHEYAAQVPTPLRDAIGNPCDLSKRPANLAISTLTIRKAPTTGDDFLLHWRDPAKVGHAGGLYQVVPVGVFQTSGPNDFDLWHFMLREYAEELLGEPEVEAPDYTTWPFALAMTNNPGIEAHVLGLGVDPLTFATDLLVQVTIDAPVFDEIFGNHVATNDEGSVTTRPFAMESIKDLPMQAAGAAAVRLALANRESNETGPSKQDEPDSLRQPHL
jgi:hypothetical protein